MIHKFNGDSHQGANQGCISLTHRMTSYLDSQAKNGT